MKKLLYSLAALTMVAAPAQAQYRVEDFTPQSFQSALVRELSGDGTTIGVKHFKECRPDTHWNDNYVCYNGFITISDPRGTRTCKIARARYHRSSATFRAEGISGCVWSY